MVSECQGLLRDDIRDQLQVAYGLQPDGTALPIERLGRLDDAGREVARQLREWQEHLGSTEIGTEPQKKKSAFDRLAHETAFTVLNRLAALRMCEERGHVVECVRRGMESDGFVLYERLSGGVFGTRGETYRVFLERMFDELAVDLSVLFDRRAPQSLLFPRDRCLEKVLSLLNSQELTNLWKEDETIGWIYQYFNSKEEREEMRAASAAPRNSRELAVRNQFFTPRYVVEFLVDNTLGRIWYEMRKGNTALKDICRYLVRRPTEIFLKEGEHAPAASTSAENLRQEELLKLPVYISHRSKKDPRDLKILDPACGSGHFLLYAFDLLETIYLEGRADERPVKSDLTGKTLRDDYADLDTLKRALPELILRHNLHGIDIDLRACQIAALALWLRAQRSYQRLSLKPTDRPKITKTNIVCAEPMPGERQFLDQFAVDIRPKVLGQLVQVVFDKMKLAGEAGSLLKIEEEIAGAVADAKRQWLAGPKPEQAVLFGDWRPQQTELSLDFSGITEETFWEKAEERIYTELQNYAERAENGHGYQRRLFSEDAARGFAFIDVCRKRYDAVLMNPPFGLATDSVFEKLRDESPHTFVELYACFVARGVSIAPGGLTGAISSRGFFTMTRLKEWRNEFVRRAALVYDLGLEVMDNAFVGSCAYVLTGSAQQFPILILDATSSEDRASLGHAANWISASLIQEGRLYVRARDHFGSIPEVKFVYKAGAQVVSLFKNCPPFESNGGEVRTGLTTFDDERFLRLAWEIDPRILGAAHRWQFFSKGGDFAKYYTDVHLVINREKDGLELAAVNQNVNGQIAQSRQGSTYYYRPGLTFTSRSARGLSIRALPSGCVISHNSPTIYALGEISNGYLLGWINSRLICTLIQMQASADYFTPGSVKMVPWTKPNLHVQDLIQDHVSQLVHRYAGVSLSEETSRNFVRVAPGSSLRQTYERLTQDADASRLGILRTQSLISDRVDEVYATPSLQLSADLLAENPDADVPLSAPSLQEFAQGSVSYWFGCAVGRWDIRFATGQKPMPELPDPFAPLPVCPPGMVQNEQGLPLTHVEFERLQASGQWHYPLDIPWDGILLDDSDHARDIVRGVREVLTVIWKDRAEAIEQEACEILGVAHLRDYFRKPSLFFADHLKRYSKSRRQAPIYWPLSTASGLYTLWVNYNRLNDDLLYTALNKYVKPKIDATEKELRRIESELPNAAGREASALRLAFEETTSLLEELQEFRDELARVAALPYKPNLNDGVLITASPLWKLFRLPKWRKDLEDCWKKLQAAEYDWAHLAYSIWPERVREVCQRDRSIAIAHGLEELCEVTTKPAKRKRSSKEKIEQAVLGEEG